EEAALSFVKSVIMAHSRAEPEAMQILLGSYADYVRYNGKRTPWLDVIHDKQSYFQRWPQRSYQMEDKTIYVDCGFSACKVEGIYSWAVRNLQRNKEASGRAFFKYTVKMSKTMRITAESSESVSE